MEVSAAHSVRQTDFLEKCLPPGIAAKRSEEGMDFGQGYPGIVKFVSALKPFESLIDLSPERVHQSNLKTPLLSCST
jgi:hypothetical protein